MTSVRVCAVVEAGGRADRNPLLPLLAEELRERHVTLTAFDATTPWAPPDLPEADLYLLKGDDPAVLSAAGCLADRGAPCVNAVEATLRVADKARVIDALARAGLPVPHTVVVAEPQQLIDLIAGDGVRRFVKPVRGAHGIGATVLDPGQCPSGPGPWLVQELVQSDGFDLKLYGVGQRSAARLVRVEPGRVDGVRQPVYGADPAIHRLGATAAQLCGLVCWGVDVLLGPDGPVLVDVNAFPGYRSVPEAARWIADVVVSSLRSGP